MAIALDNQGRVITSGGKDRQTAPGTGKRCCCGGTTLFCCNFCCASGKTPIEVAVAFNLVELATAFVTCTFAGSMRVASGALGTYNITLRPPGSHDTGCMWLGVIDPSPIVCQFKDNAGNITTMASQRLFLSLTAASGSEFFAWVDAFDPASGREARLVLFDNRNALYFGCATSGTINNSLAAFSCLGPGLNATLGKNGTATITPNLLSAMNCPPCGDCPGDCSGCAAPTNYTVSGFDPATPSHDVTAEALVSPTPNIVCHYDRASIPPDGDSFSVRCTAGAWQATLTDFFTGNTCVWNRASSGPCMPLTGWFILPGGNTIDGSFPALSFA